MKKEKQNSQDFDPIGSCKIYDPSEKLPYFGKAPKGFNTEFIKSKLKVNARTNTAMSDIIGSFTIVLN